MLKRPNFITVKQSITILLVGALFGACQKTAAPVWDQTPYALAMTMGTGLMLSDQDKSDLIEFLHTLTDEALITDPRYAAPF